MSKKKRGTSGLLVLPLLGLLGLAAWGAGPGGWFTSDDVAGLEGVRVQRGNLTIAETVRGNLEAKNSVSLKSEIEGKATILFLIDEGTMVEPGDLVAELDVTELSDRRVVQEIALQNARASYTKDKEQYEIQVIQNESDLAAANQAVEFARIDLEKYLQGDWPQQQKKADEDILLAQEKRARAEEKLGWTRDLFERGFVQRSELEGDAFAFEAATIEWDQSKRQKSLSLDYEHPRKLAELEAAVEEKRRELLRVEKQATSRLADYLAARESSMARLDLEQEKLAKIETQIEKARIVSPVAGMVVYSRSSRGWRGDDMIEEGTDVFERQELVTIPRAGGMIAQASLHETSLEKVQLGSPCRISVDALRGMTFRGSVSFVAVLPDSARFWANPNQRLYQAEISIEEEALDMRSGMSCSVEVLAAELVDVCYVPVQSVFLDAGQPVCFVRDGSQLETRPVRPGLDDGRWVAIEEGLEEGELVLLAAPPGFTPAEGDGGDSPGRPDADSRASERGSGRSEGSGSEAAPVAGGKRSKPGAGPQPGGGAKPSASVSGTPSAGADHAGGQPTPAPAGGAR